MRGGGGGGARGSNLKFIDVIIVMTNILIFFDFTFNNKVYPTCDMCDGALGGRGLLAGLRREAGREVPTS